MFCSTDVITVFIAPYIRKCNQLSIKNYISIYNWEVVNEKIFVINHRGSSNQLTSNEKIVFEVYSKKSVFRELRNK